MDFFFDRIFLPILMGVAGALFLLILGVLAYIIPVFGFLMVICSLVALLAFNPEWINKFWKQKEYRE